MASKKDLRCLIDSDITKGFNITHLMRATNSQSEQEAIKKSMVFVNNLTTFAKGNYNLAFVDKRTKRGRLINTDLNFE